MRSRPLLRRLAVLVLCAFCFASVIQPARAFVAPAVPIAPVIVTAGGLVAWTVAGIAALVAAGTVIYGITLKNGSTDVLDVRLNPKAPQPVPVNWTAGTLPYDAPVPPGSASTTAYWAFPASCPWGSSGCDQVTQYGSFGAAAAAFISACNSHSPPCSMGGTYSSGGHDYVCVADPSNPSYTCGGSPPNLSAWELPKGTTCPAGYTLSGGVCTLSNASAVPYPSDVKGKIDLGTGGFATDTRDPDNTLPTGTTVTSSAVTVTAGSSTVTITKNGDGTLSVQTINGNGNGTSTVTTMTTTAANSGASDGGTHASGVTTSTVAGEGTSTDTSKPSAISCGGGPCATESTQLANNAQLAGIKSDTNSLVTNGVKVQETGVPAAASVTQSGTFGSGNTALDTAKQSTLDKLTTYDPGKSAVSPGASWFPSFAGSDSCVEPVPLSIHGYSVPTNVCAVYAPFKAVLGWSLWLGLAVFGWLRVTRGAASAVA